MDNKGGGEYASNFLQICADDIPGLSDCMKRSQAKFTSPDIQNAMLIYKYYGKLQVRYQENGSR